MTSVADDLKVEAGAAEIAPNDVSGGPNTSHTILLPALRALLEVVPNSGQLGDYEKAALEGNVLGKSTEAARRRTLRYLKQLYLLRPYSVLFRALRDLWPDDSEGQPLLAGLCALARDTVFRASSSAIVRSSPGETLTSATFACAVGERYPDNYNESTLAKIGRNTFSSWEQTGHLATTVHRTKVRTRPTCCPANVAYALMLGHLQGYRGLALFDTLWAGVLDQPRSRLLDLAFGASQRGLLEFRQAGGVVEVGFRELLRPCDDDSQEQLL
jgi:hypothetical protein